MTQGGDKSREELAREANEVRSQLLRTVERLDERRHRIADVRLQLGRHVRQIVGLGVVAALAMAGAAVLIARRIASAPRRRWRERWRAARGVWRHPERVKDRPSFLSALVRGVLLSILSASVTIPARRALNELLGRPST